jgi:hypothetical protein
MLFSPLPRSTPALQACPGKISVAIMLRVLREKREGGEEETPRERDGERETGREKEWLLVHRSILLVILLLFFLLPRTYFHDRTCAAPEVMTMYHWWEARSPSMYATVHLPCTHLSSNIHRIISSSEKSCSRCGPWGGVGGCSEGQQFLCIRAYSKQAYFVLQRFQYAICRVVW